MLKKHCFIGNLHLGNVKVQFLKVGIKEISDNGLFITGLRDM